MGKYNKRPKLRSRVRKESERERKIRRALRQEKARLKELEESKLHEPKTNKEQNIEVKTVSSVDKNKEKKSFSLSRFFAMIPAFFVGLRRNKLNNKADKLPKAKEPVEKKAKLEKPQQKDIPEPYVVKNKGINTCYGAKPKDAKANDIKRAESAGVKNEREASIKGAIPPSNKNIDVDRIAPVDNIDKAKPKSKAEKIIVKGAGSKMNFMRRWLGDIIGLIVSIIIIILFLLATFFIARAIVAERNTTETATVESVVEKTTTPAIVEVAEEKEEPVELLQVADEEPVAVAPVEEEIISESVEKSTNDENSTIKESISYNGFYEFEGYRVDVNAKDGRAIISYPEFIPEKEIAAFINSEAIKYHELAGFASYSFGKDGTLEVAYPDYLTADELEGILGVLASDLTSYLSMYLKDSTRVVEEEKKEESIIVENSTNVEESKSEVVETAAVEEPIVAEKTPMVEEPAEQEVAEETAPVESVEPIAVEEDILNVHRIVVTTAGVFDIDAYDGYADILYPANIPNAEIDKAMALLASSYPEYASYVSYSLPESGKARLSYPTGLEEAEINLYIDMLIRELEWYLSPQEEIDSSNTNIYNITINNAVEEEGIEEPIVEVEEEWERPIHTLTLSGSPYGFSYVDFFNVMDMIEEKKEFSSGYGYGFNLDYEWKFSSLFSVGAEAGLNIFLPNRSTLPDKTLYIQGYMLAKAGIHYEWKHLGLFANLAIGLDMPSLLKTNSAYFMTGIELGLSWRFTENWAIQLKALGGLTYQKNKDTALLDSITYMIQPALIGVSYSF